jgi:hypothetical protein
VFTFLSHGGDSASVFAKNHLLNFIIEQEEFWSLDDNDVKESIRKGFLACHHAMWKNIGKFFIRIFQFSHENEVYHMINFFH